jgi:cytochrome c biogenesis protein CcmG/thiol:disulfide interchange protein DsbE
MANRERAEARRKAQAKAGNGGGALNPKVWIAAAAAVILIVVAVVLFTGDDDDSDASNGTDTTEQTGGGFPDSQPVTVTGESLPPFSSASGDLAVGLPAPLLEGLNFQGDAVTVDPATAGEPYMLVFLAHWCPHCNAEVPRLLDWKNSGAVPSDLNVLGVATASAEGAANYPPASWLSNKGWSWPVLVDELGTPGEAGKAAIAYGASGWPYFVIVGGDGLVKARYSGEIEVDALQELVDAALA